MNKIISARHIVFILFLALVGLTVAYLVNKNFSEWDSEITSVLLQAFNNSKAYQTKKIIRINPRTNFRECLLNMDIVSFLAYIISLWEFSNFIPIISRAGPAGGDKETD